MGSKSIIRTCRCLIAACLLLLQFGGSAECGPEPEPAGRHLQLSAQEAEWVKQHPVVKVRVSPDYPPFEFIEGGHYQGMAYDYLMAAGRRLGITFEPVSGLTWKESLDRIEAKQGVDLIIMITRTADRSRFLEFTRDYISFPLVVFTRKDAPFISGIKDLAGKSVAMERGFIFGEWLKRDVPDVSLRETILSREAIEAVSTGKADAYVGNLALGTYLIEKLGYVNMKVAAPTPYGPDALAMGVRKDWPELAQLLDRALASMTDEEVHAIRSRWLSVRYEHGITRYDVVRWVVIAVGLVVAGTLLMRLRMKRRAEAELMKEMLSRRESDKKIRALLDQTSEFIGMLSPDGTVIDANNTALEFAGVDRIAVVGRPFWETPWWSHSTEMAATVREAISRASSGQSVRFEATHTSGTGSFHYIDFSLKPVMDENGKVLFLIPEGRDITERKKMENDLLQEKDYSNAIVDSLPGIFFITDENGRLLRWNNNEIVTTGYSSEDLSGMNVLQLIPDNRELAAQKLKEVLETGRASMEAVIVAKSGQKTPFYINGFRLIRDNRRFVIGMGIDLSERKELETRLVQSQKMEAIGTLAGGIAHDFNNILAPIMGYTEMAQMLAKDDPKLNEYLGYISEASSRATGLVRQILTFSRKAELQKMQLQISSIVKEALKLLRSSIPASIEIRQEIQTAAMVYADPVQIHQIVMNLCTNAYHAMETSGGVLAVSLKEVSITGGQAIGGDTAPGRYIVLEVSDTGCGMDKETLTKIFEPYFTTKEKGRGTGLGLAVVHGIVKEHHGKITVYSEQGKGSTFKVYLPIVEGRHEVQPTDSEKISQTDRNELILFVDDEERIRTMAKDYLTGHGYRVEICANGRDALIFFEQDPKAYDILITDMTMPGMNGKELAKKVLQIRPELPVILCTGYSSLIDREEAMNAGIRDYVEKPVVMADLLGRIRKLPDGK